MDHGSRLETSTVEALCLVLHLNILNTTAFLEVSFVGNLNNESVEVQGRVPGVVDINWDAQTLRLIVEWKCLRLMSAGRVRPSDLSRYPGPFRQRRSSDLPH